LNAAQIDTIANYLAISGSNEEKLLQVQSLLGNEESGKQGIAEIEFLSQQAKNTNLVIDLTLARGLNYYTGIIFEAKAPAEINMGSIGGGGRYDDLTGLFGVPNIPGVGISFGVDRIYDVLEEMNLFPDNLQVNTKALFFNMGEKESTHAFGIMQQLRSKGIACELFHEPLKIDKQFKYAEKKHIPFVVIIGSKEMEAGNCQVKKLGTGEQQLIAENRLADFFNSL
jgi:histidyl-tRNA synthetase